MSLINVAEVEISPTISFTRVHWTEFCGVFLFLKVRLGSFGAVVGRNLVHSKMFQLLGRVWGALFHNLFLFQVSKHTVDN